MFSDSYASHSVRREHAIALFEGGFDEGHGRRPRRQPQGLEAFAKAMKIRVVPSRVIAVGVCMSGLSVSRSVEPVSRSSEYRLLTSPARHEPNRIRRESGVHTGANRLPDRM